MSGIRRGDVSRIEQKFRQLPDDLQTALRAKVAAAGQQVLADAQSRVPVDLGELRRGITLSPKGAFGWAITVLALARRGRHRFNYGWFVEFGTKRSVTVTISRAGRSRKIRRRVKRNLGGNAQPFLLPAFRRAARPILREIRAAIRNHVRALSTKR